MNQDHHDHRAMMAARLLLGKVLRADARPMVDGEVVTVRLDDLAALRDVLQGLAGDWRPVLPSSVSTATRTSTLVIPERRPGPHGSEAVVHDATASDHDGASPTTHRSAQV